MMDLLKESYFKATHNEYMAVVLRDFLTDNWIWIAIPVAVCLCMAYIDIKFIIVALLIVCVAMPMLLAMVYFYFVLTVEACWSVVDKTITLNEKGDILLHFADKKRKDRLVTQAQVKMVKINRNSVILSLKVRRYTYLLVPLSQFKSFDGVERFVRLYDSSVK